jgi:cytochrome b561
MDTPQRYNYPSMLLHWLIAVLIISAFALGTIMTDMKFSPTKLQYYAWHKWLGVCILALVAVRLLVRLFSPQPAPLTSSSWETILAKCTHIGLYVLMFSVPLSGYFMSLAAGYPVVLFKVIELPVFIGADPILKESLTELHELLNYVMLATVLLHIAGALKHQIVDKKAIFKRILPLK